MSFRRHSMPRLSYPTANWKREPDSNPYSCKDYL